MNRRELLRAFIGGAATLLTRPWDWLTRPIELPIETGLFGSSEGILFDRTVFPSGVTFKNGEGWTYTYAIYFNEKGEMTVESGTFDIVKTPECDDMVYIGIG